MQVYRTLAEIPFDASTVLTLGTFDGVHPGHMAILGETVARARATGARSMAVTFDPHPRQVVHGLQVPLLTTTAEKVDLIATTGIDALVVVPFTPAFAALAPDEFVERVLVGGVGLERIVVGFDHGFGRGRSGSIELLRELGTRLGFEVDVVPPLDVEGQTLSSSAIREALEKGDVARAAVLLGRPYRVSSVVGRGQERGRTIGFPTANLTSIAPEKILPARGVYAVRVALPDSEVAPGMMNIGLRPTFDGTTLSIEVHLIGFEGDLYEREITVSFIDRIRDERRFESIDALIAQLHEDRAHCIRLLGALN